MIMFMLNLLESLYNVLMYNVVFSCLDNESNILDFRFCLTARFVLPLFLWMFLFDGILHVVVYRLLMLAFILEQISVNYNFIKHLGTFFMVGYQVILINKMGTGGKKVKKN